MKSANFKSKLNIIEQRAWKCYTALWDNYDGNNRSVDYVTSVNYFLSPYNYLPNTLIRKVSKFLSFFISKPKI